MTEPTERIVSVADLAHGLKRILEERTQGIWLEGEVGQVQRPGSGHLYFTLKDEGHEATVDCVLYRREALRFSAKIVAGARLQVRGRATFYAPRGRVQWVGEAVRPSGQGALLLALAELKEKLAKEGLFDASRKKPIPTSAKTIGVVTSKTGAAFADICTVAERRGAVRILLASAVVQGEGAPQSLIAALDKLDRCPDVDVVIFGRGGGSAEDLMAFSDERVLRRLARMRVPVISAVGHEIDHSLSDLVADARAATPSQAAEMVVPDAGARVEALRRLTGHLRGAMQRKLREAELLLRRAERRLGDPRVELAERRQHLDDLRLELAGAMRGSMRKDRMQLTSLVQRLERRHPRAVLSRAHALLAPLNKRLELAMASVVEGRRLEIARRAAQLDALSPLSVLARGYSIALTPAGAAVRSVHELQTGAEVRVRLTDGQFSAVVQALETLG